VLDQSPALDRFSILAQGVGGFFMGRREFLCSFSAFKSSPSFGFALPLSTSTIPVISTVQFLILVYGELRLHGSALLQKLFYSIFRASFL
jgi:hypothetical protein